MVNGFRRSVGKRIVPNRQQREFVEAGPDVELVTEIDAVGAEPHGLVWVNDGLWVADYFVPELDDGGIYKIDKDGNQLALFDHTFNFLDTGGLTFDGQDLWLTDWGNIHRLSLGGEILDTFEYVNAPESSATGIAWSEETGTLWVSDIGRSELLELGTDGSLLRRFDIPEPRRAITYGIEKVGDLVVAVNMNLEQSVTRFMVFEPGETDALRVVTEFGVPGNWVAAWGVAESREQFWHVTDYWTGPEGETGRLGLVDIAEFPFPVTVCTVNTALQGVGVDVDMPLIGDLSCDVALLLLGVGTGTVLTAQLLGKEQEEM